MSEKEINDFIDHANNTVCEMIDGFLDLNKEYEEKYNLKIELYGKKLELDLHASLFESLLNLLHTELEDYKEFPPNENN
jgi:hypothetical protein